MRLRERLRAETRQAHDRVDAAFARFDLSTREGYADFLSAHAAALPAMEAALEAHGAPRLLPDWEARRRTPALLADLQRLGATAAGPGAAFNVSGESAVLGALYVLEGSRLGARLLLAEVRRSGDATVRGAAAYLGHGQGRRFWPEFLRVLEGRTDPQGEVLEGALAAFAAFEAAALRPLRASRA